MSGEEPVSEFTYARIVQGLHPYFTWQLIALTALTGVALIALRSELELAGPARIGVALATVLSAVAVAVFGVLALRELRRAPRRIALCSESLRLMGSDGRLAGEVPYEVIQGVDLLQNWSPRIAVRRQNRPTLTFVSSGFDSPAAAEAFYRELVGRVPDVTVAGEIAPAFTDEREKIEAIRAPWLAIAPAVGIAVIYLAHRGFSPVPFERDTFFLAFASHGDALKDGQVYRLVTAAWLHLDWLHLATNLCGLLVMGSIAELMLGRKRVVIIGGLGSIGGFLLSSALHPARYTVGSSAWILALTGACVVLLAARRSRPGGGRLIPMGTLAVLLANGIVSEQVPALADHAAHGGSFVCGLALGWWVFRAGGTEPASPTRDLAETTAAVVVGVAYLSAAAVLFWWLADGVLY